MANRARPRRSPRWRSRLRRLGVPAAVVLALLVGALLLFRYGVTFDLERFRPRIEQALGEQIGAPVRLGEARIRIAPWPELWLRDARIGAGGAEWLRVGSAETEVALFPLLRRRELRISRVRAAGVVLDLTREPPRPPARAPDTRDPRLRVLELRELGLEDIEIVLPDTEAPRRIRVAHLELTGAEGEPLELSLTGGFRGPRVALESIELEGAGGSLLEAQGDGAWPLRLGLRSPGIELDLEAQIPALGSGSPGGSGAIEGHGAIDGSVELRAESLGILLQTLGVSVPREGVAGLAQAAELSLEGRWHQKRLATAALDTAVLDTAVLDSAVVARVAGTTVIGDLQLADREERLLLSGALRTESLALVPWLPPAPETGSSEQELDWREVAVDSVAEALYDLGLDIEIGLSVEEVFDPRFQLAGIEARVEWTKGRIELPFEATLEGSPLEGTLIALTETPPEVQLSARAGKIELTRWWGEAAPSDHVTRLEVELAAKGSTLGEWLDSLRGDASLEGLTLADLRRNPDKPPVSLTVEELHATQQGELTLSSSAKFFDRPLRLELSTSRLATLFGREPTVPLRAHIAGEHGRASALGRWGTDGGRGTELEVDLDVDRLGRFADWIGVSEQLELPARAQGRLAIDEDRVVSVEAALLQVGSSSGSLSAQLDAQRRRLSIRGESPLVDLDELTDGGQSAGESPGPNEPTDSGLANWREIPLVPKSLEGWQASIDLRVEQLRRYGVDVDELALHLEVDENLVTDSSVEFEIASAPFHGAWSVDQQGDTPELRVTADTRDLDLGSLLEAEDVADGLDLQIGRLGWETRARGQTLGELVDSARNRAEIEDAVYWLSDEAGERREPFVLTAATLEGSARGGLIATGAGAFRETPLELTLETVSLVEASKGERVPFELRLASPGAELVASGETPREGEPYEVQLEVTGADGLSGLGWLLDAELPASPPFVISGRLEGLEDHWSATELALEWAESRVEGELEVDFGSERPRLTGALRAPRLRLVDLFPEVLAENVTESPEWNAEEASAVEGNVRVSMEPWTLESDPLPSIDLALEVDLERIELPDGVTSQADLTLDLDTAGLQVDIQGVDTRGGSGAGHLRFEPGEESARLKLEASLDGFDYSNLADRIEGYGAEEGRIGFYIDLDTEAAWGAPLMARMDGTLAFLVNPTHFEAASVDLWAADLATSLIPKLGWASSPSTVNCLAAFARFEEGVADDVRAIMDTTRVRVNGRGEIDLGERSLDLKLKPRPKRRSLLSLATPVRIRGQNGEFDVRVTSSGVVWTFVRIGAYVYTLALEVLKRPLPADGSDACVDLFAGKVEKNKWRPGHYLTQPDELIEDVIEGPTKDPPP